MTIQELIDGIKHSDVYSVQGNGVYHLTAAELEAINILKANEDKIKKVLGWA